MSRNKFNIFFAIVLSLSFSVALSQDRKKGINLIDIPGYPTVFELNKGEEYQINRQTHGKNRTCMIKLLSVEPSFSPEFWSNKDGSQNLFYRSAKVVVEIDGKREELLHRPYQMPESIHGLRFYVEAIKSWAENAEYGALKNMQKEVRFSVCADGESWGPSSLVYPIEDYRFRSSSYNNTWGSLVPYNLLYYHRGEDRGALPDRLGVVEPIDGTVVGTPIPNGDGASNGVVVVNSQGFYVRIGHMDIENINPGLVVDALISKGTLVGNTGMTWSGARNQVSDPHIHIELGFRMSKEDQQFITHDNFIQDAIKLSPFPYLMEAYFRKYSDPVIAIAGGYEYTTPGQSIALDGSRSIARPGQRIKSYAWVLHNGTKVDGAKTSVTYDSPGLYTEELIVETSDGSIDRDFLQVRVWDPKFGRDIASGWVYQYPVRQVKVNQPVLFSCKFRNTIEPIKVDFGDGSPLLTTKQQDIAHPYRRPGRYVVTFSSVGPRNVPLVEKLEVIIEE